MKKLWLNIVIFLNSIARGLKRADSIILEEGSEGEDGVGIEQKKETQSVYKDLLRGEVTQEVKELRHEMYYAERKSYGYKYLADGRAVKKNSIFDYSGKIETSDGNKVEIVLENHEDPSSLYENDIFCVGENVELGERALQDFRVKDKRDFTIVIDRDFVPSFRIEEFATKIVVKRIDSVNVLLDIYVPVYIKQFDKRSRMFHNRMDEIYMGDVRSDIIDFNELSFITFKAYGAEDLKRYKYNNIKFDDIISFDGSYVLRFSANVEENGYDIIEEFYDEIAAQKNEKHVPRKENGSAISFDAAVTKISEEEYDIEQASELAKTLNGNN